MHVRDMWANDHDSEAQILEAAKTILRRRLTRLGTLEDPSKTTEYLRAHCAHLEHEIFGCIFLDTRHRIIAIEDLFRGSIASSEVHPREVCKRALAANASAAVIFHNHPSGLAEPSAADRAVTTRLKQALDLIEVRLLDHFVIAGETYTSFAARGWV